jgi:RNA polymerase sigma-70 factor (ECF subfamily)
LRLSRPWRPDSPEDLARIRRAVVLAKRGDRLALRFLYCTYSPIVRRYVAALLRDPHDAEDVTQTTFLKLMTSLDRYEPGDAPFEAWLLRVARNAAFDELRRRRASRAAELAEGDGVVEFDPDARTGRIADALASLPPAQRDVLVLRHLAGLSPVEIAERLDRSEAAVNILHHRGSAKLRDALTAVGAAPPEARVDRSASASLRASRRWATMPVDSRARSGRRPVVQIGR